MVEQLLSMYKTPGLISSKKRKKRNKGHPGLQRQFQDSQNYTVETLSPKTKREKKRKEKKVLSFYTLQKKNGILVIISTVALALGSYKISHDNSLCIINSNLLNIFSTQYFETS